MRKRGALTPAALLLAIAGTTGEAPAAPPPPRPSVVLVTLDTTRADHLGAYGAAFARTPNLDAVARGGVRFDRARAPAPLTLPSHATMLTSLVPRRHGIRDNAGFRLAAGTTLLTERLRASGWDTAAFVSSAVLDRAGGLDRGFRIYDDGVRVGDRAAFGHVERAAGATTDAAIAALPRLREPFFLWVHYFDPHLPYVPPEPHRSRFSARPYDGEIAFMDEALGRLLAAVRKRAGPALVVVAGDHGESLGEHGEDAHGLFLYDATQRVPLLLAGPGIPPGRVVAENVGLVDLAPTVLDLVGLAPLPGVDGRTLAPLWKGSGGRAPDYEMETFYPRFAHGFAPLRALVRGSAKWIEAPRPELYDLASDPQETKNLAAARPREARALGASLATLVGADDPGHPRADPDLEERREKLVALGYVGGAVEFETPPIDPKDGALWLSDLEAGRRALQLGNPADGIAPLERLLRKNPGNVQARIALGLCRLRSGDPAGAEREMREATRLHPDRALPWVRLGDVLASRSRAPAEARAAYLRALDLHPREPDAFLGLLAIEAAAKDGAAIERLVARARRVGFADPTFDTETGLLALARGRADEAKASLERAVAANPREARALEGLGRIAYGRGDPKEAEGWYARALEAAPSSALAKTLGAIRLHALGDRIGARAAFERARALSPPGDPDLPEIEALLRELAGN